MCLRSGTFLSCRFLATIGGGELTRQPSGQGLCRLRRVQSHLALFLRQLHQLAGADTSGGGWFSKWGVGYGGGPCLCFLFAFVVYFWACTKSWLEFFTGATSISDFAKEKGGGLRNSRFLIAFLSHHPLPLPPLVAARSPLEGGLPLAAPPLVVAVMASCARSAHCPAPGSSFPAP